MATERNDRGTDQPHKPGQKPRPQKPGSAKPANPDKGHPQFQKWWEHHLEASVPFHPSLPAEEIKAVALAAFKAGVEPKDLNVLFGNKAENLFASNYAGGQGQPSPYLDYFKSHLGEAPKLVEFLKTHNPDTPQGQQAAFDTFGGLRESYLTSVGDVEVANAGGGTTIRDAEFTRLTPYQADLKRRRDAGLVTEAPAQPGGPTNFDPYSNVGIGQGRGRNPGGREGGFYQPAVEGFDATQGFATVQDGLANSYVNAVSSGDIDAAGKVHQALQQHREFVDLYQQTTTLGQPTFNPRQTSSFSAEEL
jgi:hypothetical protein